MRHARFVRAVLTASILSTASAAFAAEPSPQDIAQARDLAQQAAAASEAGNHAEAEKLWTAAQNLYPAAPTITLGLARTQAKLGKFVASQESYNKIIREQGHATNLSPAFKDALESAKSEVGSVSAKLAAVTITVEGGESPTVTLDGQPVSNAALGLKRPVDPGSHVVKAEAKGFKPGEKSFQVSEGAAADVKLVLEKSPDAPPPAAADTPTTAPAAEAGTGKSSNKTLAIVALGVGGAGLVFGAVTGILAMGKHGDLEEKCPDGQCPADAQSDIDSYKTMGTLSTVGFIVGGVGVAAGAVLWLTAPKEKRALASPSFRTASGTTFQPFVGPTGAGVTGRF